MKYKLKRSIRLCLGIASLSFLVPLQSEAQSIKRQAISSYGSSSFSEGILIQQTAGQSYNTKGYYSEKMSIRPGFQQLTNFRLESIHQSENLNLDVYPNPAVYSFSIESQDEIIDASIIVTSLEGKVMVNEKLPELRMHTINCDSWPNGIYIINLFDKEKGKYSSKLIINK